MKNSAGGGEHRTRPSALALGPRLRLAKAALCLLIGGATLFGALLAEPQLSSRALLVSLAVFILACGAASLNSLQEYRLDRQMSRTRLRPLPLGQISTGQAGWQAVLLISIGIPLLACTSAAAEAPLLALLALLLYNGVYTPLKTTTVLAILPGVLCGALPPLVGWTAAGGGLISYTAGLLAALLVLWQVPHFWLVLLRHPEDYRRLGLPNVLEQFGETRIKAFFLTWIGALATVMLMFLVLPYSLPWPLRLAGAGNAAVLLMVFACQLRPGGKNDYRLLFFSLNLALLTHLILVGCGRLLG